ncbi:MAG: hypothetical protein Q7K42_03315 [Candidatus Diapherotrites archaeon]|nr:hypothetical protein [Candidatus Diapherotrites archaeon]
MPKPRRPENPRKKTTRIVSRKTVPQVPKPGRIGLEKEGMFSKSFNELKKLERDRFTSRYNQLSKGEIANRTPIEREELDALHLFIYGDVFGGDVRMKNFLDILTSSETKVNTLRRYLTLALKIFGTGGYSETEAKDYVALRAIIYGDKSILRTG